MYELILKGEQRIKFKAEAKKRLEVKGWDMKVLASEIGRPVNTVYKFFSNSSKSNRFVAAEIAKVLDMKPKDWR